jgi:hypothetical protein
MKLIDWTQKRFGTWWGCFAGLKKPTFKISFSNKEYLDKYSVKIEIPGHFKRQSHAESFCEKIVSLIKAEINIDY